MARSPNLLRAGASANVLISSLLVCAARLPDYGLLSSGSRPPTEKPMAAPKSTSPIFADLCAELLPTCAVCGARLLRAQASSSL